MSCSALWVIDGARNTCPTNLQDLAASILDLQRTRSKRQREIAASDKYKIDAGRAGDRRCVEHAAAGFDHHADYGTFVGCGARCAEIAGNRTDAAARAPSYWLKTCGGDGKRGFTSVSTRGIMTPSAPASSETDRDNGIFGHPYQRRNSIRNGTERIFERGAVKVSVLHVDDDGVRLCGASEFDQTGASPSTSTARQAAFARAGLAAFFEPVPRTQTPRNIVSSLHGAPSGHHVLVCDIRRQPGRAKRPGPASNREYIARIHDTVTVDAALDQTHQAERRAKSTGGCGQSFQKRESLGACLRQYQNCPAHEAGLVVDVEQIRATVGSLPARARRRGMRNWPR